MLDLQYLQVSTIIDTGHTYCERCLFLMRFLTKVKNTLTSLCCLICEFNVWLLSLLKFLTVNTWYLILLGMTKDPVITYRAAQRATTRFHTMLHEASSEQCTSTTTNRTTNKSYRLDSKQHEKQSNQLFIVKLMNIP